MQVFTILILEDEPYIALELAESAKESGYEVVLANSAGEALNIIADIDALHLALLDIKMEGESLDGVDVAKQIQIKFNIPIIFFTAYGQDRDIKEKATSISNAAFLEKGQFNLIEDVYKKINDYLEEYSANKEGNNEIICKSNKLIINSKFDYTIVSSNQEEDKKESKRRRMILSVDEIYCIAKSQDSIEIQTRDDIFLISCSFTWLIEQIKLYLSQEDQDKLCLAHQSYIVNIDKVVAYDKVKNTHYVYFDRKETRMKRAVPVNPLFIDFLEQRFGRIVSKPSNKMNDHGKK